MDAEARAEGLSWAEWARRVLLAALTLCSLACSGLGDPDARLCLVGWEQWPDRADDIQSAASEWGELTGGEARLTFESAPAESGCSSGSVPVEARWVPNETRAGHTEPDRIWLDASYSEGFRRAALHELGHFLCGGGHSDDPKDVMFGWDSDEQSEHLTMGDLAMWMGVR